MSDNDNLSSKVSIKVNEREIKGIKTAFQYAATKFGLNENNRNRSLDSSSIASSTTRVLGNTRKFSLDSNYLKAKSGSISSPLKWKKNSQSKWVPDEPKNQNDTPVFNSNIRRISLQPQQKPLARLLSRKVSNESYFGPASKKSSIDLMILKKDLSSLKKTTSDSMMYSSKEKLNIKITKKDDDDEDTSTITSESLSEKHCLRDDDSARFIEFDDTDSIYDKPKSNQN